MLKVWIKGCDIDLRWVLSTLHLNQPYVKILKAKRDDWHNFTIKFQTTDYQFLNELMNHINNNTHEGVCIYKIRGKEKRNPKYTQQEILKGFCLDHLQPIMKYGDADERLRRFEEIVEIYSSAVKELETVKLDF